MPSYYGHTYHLPYFIRLPSPLLRMHQSPGRPTCLLCPDEFTIMSITVSTLWLVLAIVKLPRTFRVEVRITLFFSL